MKKKNKPGAYPISTQQETLLPPAATPLPAYTAGQNWVYREEFESMGPSTPGAQPPRVGSAQGKRECAYLEVHHFALSDFRLHLRPWILMTSQSTSLLSQPSLRTQVRRTLALSEQHAELDTHDIQDTQISSSRVGPDGLSDLSPPSPLHWTFPRGPALGYWNMSILPITPEAPEPRALF